MKYYTGVGSRETPKHILEFMRKVGKAMADKGYVGRSGGARGADTAFYEGMLDSTNLGDLDFECYLPWEGFNNYFSKQEFMINTPKLGNYLKAQDLVRDIHPAFDRLTRGPLALHTRNVYQVLGKDLTTPSTVLFCYGKVDKQGVVLVGTRTVYVLAKQHDIPCYNFFFEEDVDKVNGLLKL